MGPPSFGQITLRHEQWKEDERCSSSSALVMHVAIEIFAELVDKLVLYYQCITLERWKQSSNCKDRVYNHICLNLFSSFSRSIACFKHLSPSFSNLISCQSFCLKKFSAIIIAHFFSVFKIQNLTSYSLHKKSHCVFIQFLKRWDHYQNGSVHTQRLSGWGMKIFWSIQIFKELSLKKWTHPNCLILSQILRILTLFQD